MKNKLFSGFFLVIILMVTLCLAFNIQYVNAQEGSTVYILGDGTLNPPTAPLLREDDLYTLTEDFVGNIIVWTDNIVIDGNGFTLQGSGLGTGIDLTEATNITIQNMVIKGFSNAIYIRKSSFITVRNNTLTENGGLNTPIINEAPTATSSNNTFSQNIITDNNGIGIVLSGNYGNASGNLITRNIGSGIRLNGVNATVFGNTITNNTETGLLSYGSDNVITENTIANNTYGLVLSGYNNLFYLNNFVDNTQLVSGFGSSINRWDNGTHGNYWSDYTGIDVDGDGIGETPYIIDSNNQDNYPLAEEVVVIAIPEVSSWMLVLTVFAVLTVTITLYNRKSSNK
ncbi:MAG: right-handed parallel beta-helix repeat-containing protein [Candidatus Bathyarchaeota archaeon]|nr:right-handed parallel beta-helix repeat-containing protein [Candidatus Bathyarchaeota archaeon]